MARLLRSTPPQPQYKGPNLPPPVAPFAPISVNLATGLLTNQRRAQQRRTTSDLRPPTVVNAQFIAAPVGVSFTAAVGRRTSGVLRFPLQGWEQDSTGQTGSPYSVASATGAGSSTSSLVVGDSSAEQQLGQGLADPSWPISQVTLWLRKAGAPTDNLTVTLQTGTGTPDRPSGTVLATSNAVSGASLGTSFAPVTFTFPAAYATGSVWVVLQRSGAPDAANFYRWEAATPNDPAYQTAVFDGASWTPNFSQTALAQLANGSYRPIAALQRRFLGPRPPLVTNPLPSQQQQTVAVTPASGLFTNQRRAQQRRTTSVLRPPILPTATFVASPIAVATFAAGYRRGLTRRHVLPYQESQQVAQFNAADPGTGALSTVLDTFPVDGALSANWATISTTAAVVGGAYADPGATAVGNYWQVKTFGPDAYVAADIVHFSAQDTRFFKLFLGLATPNGAARGGYSLKFSVSTSGPDRWEIINESVAGGASVVATGFRDASSGDRIALRSQGNTVTAYWNGQPVVSYTAQTTPMPQGGFIGLFLQFGSGDPFTLDNFGGGESAGSPLSYLTGSALSPVVGLRPPVVLAALPTAAQTTQTVYPATGLLTNQRRAQQRRVISVLRPPIVPTGIFVAPPLNVNCVSPDRLAHRYRRMPSQASLNPPTTLQTFGGPAVTDVALRTRVERQRHRLPDSFLLPPATLEPESVFLAERTPRPQTVRIRPRHTIHALTPPTVVRVPAVEQQEQTVRVALARIRPRPTRKLLGAPTALQVFAAPVAPPIRTRPRPTTTLLPPPTVVRVPSVEQREDTISVVLARIRPRATTRRLAAPTVLQTFAGPQVTLARTRPRTTRRFLAPPTVVRVPSVEQAGQTIRTALTHVRPRPTVKRLAPPTALQVFGGPAVTLAHIRPRPTSKFLGEPTVVRVPSVEQAEDTIRVTLVTLRASQRRRTISRLTAISYPQAGEVQVTLTRATPRPTTTFLTAVSYPATSDIAVTLVRTRPRATVKALSEPTALQTFQAGTPKLVTVRPRPTRHLLGPPTVVRVPSVEQQEDTIRVALVRTRPRPTRHFIVPPVVKTFPPVVTTLTVVTVAVRRRTEQSRHVVGHFLRPPQAVIPLPTLRVQTVQVSHVTTRPRPTSKRLFKPTVLQTFVGVATPLVHTRPRPTHRFLNPPTVVRIPAVEQEQRTIQTTFVRIRPRPKAVVQVRPVRHAATSEIAVTLATLRRARPQPTRSILTDVTYPQTGGVAVTLVATRPPQKHALLRPPTVVRVPSVEQQEDTVRVSLVRTRPRPVVSRLTFVTVATRTFAAYSPQPVSNRPRSVQTTIHPPARPRPVETALRVSLTHVRPRPTVARLPLVVVASALARPVAVTTASPVRTQTRSRLAPSIVVTTPFETAIRATHARVRPRRTVSFLRPPTVVTVVPPNQAQQTILVKTVAPETRKRFRVGRHALPFQPPVIVARVGVTDGYDIAATAADGGQVGSSATDGDTVPGTATEGGASTAAASNIQDVPATAAEGDDERSITP